jgi:hypothetical protein
MKNKKTWHPSQYFSKPDICQWQEHPDVKGALSFVPRDQEHAVEILKAFGHTDPYDHLDGQPELFQMKAGYEIERLVLVKKEEHTCEGQSTDEMLSDESQATLTKSGPTRRTSGKPDVKNPPIYCLSDNLKKLEVDSGHNRWYYSENTFPGEFQLGIETGKPKNLHKNASPSLAKIRKKRKVNPPKPTRSLKRTDHVLNLQQAMEADKYITHETEGTCINPKGKPYKDMESNSTLFNNICDYVLCGWANSQQERTNIHNCLVHGPAKDGRKLAATAADRFHHLTTWGWADGVPRTAEGKCQPDYPLVDWKHHIDYKNKALILTKDLVGTHFDTSFYPIIEQYFRDPVWRAHLEKSGINQIFIYCSVTIKSGKINTLKALNVERGKQRNRLIDANELFEKIPGFPLRVTKRMLASQFKKEELRVEDIPLRHPSVDHVSPETLN